MVIALLTGIITDSGIMRANVLNCVDTLKVLQAVISREESEHGEPFALHTHEFNLLKKRCFAPSWGLP